MKRLLMSLGLFVAVVGTSAMNAGTAQAATIYTNVSVNLWAGPSPDYPRVVRLPAGVAVTVYGCLDDWYWCDVSWRGQRGWVYADNLYGRYGGNRVYLSQYGPQFGFGIIQFSIGSYWDRYYRGNKYSWYRERDRYMHQPPPRYRPDPRREGHFNRPAVRRPDQGYYGSNNPNAGRSQHNRQDGGRQGQHDRRGDRH